MTRSRADVNLDGVATSPPLPDLARAVLPWLSTRHANPASPHRPGRLAARAMDDARASVAALVGASPERVIFTSGATEANNLALRGIARLARREGRIRLAVPVHEHPSLLHPARSLAREGWDPVPIEVLPAGHVDPRRLPGGPLGAVALSHAHAELGSLQPVQEIVAAARDAGAFTLVDASLTAGRVPVDLADIGHPDCLSLSFHHMGGPMGIGALVMGTDLPLPPLLEGGVQERGFRPGSPNLAGCVGAEVAARAACEEASGRAENLRILGEILADGLRAVPGTRLTCPRSAARLPGHVAAIFDEIDGEALRLALEDNGVIAATGSPCEDAAGIPSAALRAAGYSPREVRGALVFCVPPIAGPDEAGLRRALAVVEAQVRRLRRLAGGMARPKG